MRNARRAWLVGSGISVLGFGLWTGCAGLVGDFDPATISEGDGATGDGMNVPADAGSDQDASMSIVDAGGMDVANDVAMDQSMNEAGEDVAVDGPSDDGPSEGSTTDASDAGDASDASEAGPCESPPTTEFYVDAATGNDSNNGGATTCAFKTITAALAASAVVAHANATIHLAAGTYSSGETFPLVVNHGRSLVGAGLGTTKIQGSSAKYNTMGTASFLDTGSHFLTILAGDVMGGMNNFGRSTLSGFTLLPDATVTMPTVNYVGLACIVGNAPNTGATPPLPMPNLLVQSVKFGPNYDDGLIVGSSPSQSTACNVTVTESTFTGMNTGIETGACGTANPVQSWPSAQIGDGVPSDANTFAGSGIDILGGGCGSLQSINHNTFASGYRGIVIISQPAQYFEILGNTFTGGTMAFPMGIGLQTSSSVAISKLNANTFTNIAQTAAADTAVGQTTGFAMIVASVLQARQNVIHDNDNGVEVGVSPAVTFDFSSDGTLSNANEIYCNSKPSGAMGTGYDIILSYGSGIAANFAGNYMDHASPTTSASLTTSTNGTDVVTGTSNGAILTGSNAIGTACTSARVH